jgi:hypothetical protein
MIPAHDIGGVIDRILEAAHQDPVVIRDLMRQLTVVGAAPLYQCLVDPETAAGTKLAIFSKFAELGDLVPKKEALPQHQGAQFSISINIPSIDGKPPVTIQGTVATEEPRCEMIEGEPPSRVIAWCPEDNNDLRGGGEDGPA